MSKKILANDGIDNEGKALLEKAGFIVITYQKTDNFICLKTIFLMQTFHHVSAQLQQNRML